MQLGNATAAYSATPLAVPGISNASAVYAGGGFSCALLSDSTARCWGDNALASLGNNSHVNSATPVAVLKTDLSAPLSGIAALATGSSHACARLQSKPGLLLGR